MKTLSNHLLLLVQTVLFLFVALAAGCKHPEHSTTSPADTITTTAAPTTTDAVPTTTAVPEPTTPSSDHRLIAYIADWALPEKIAWDKLDQVIYSFAVPNENGELGEFNGDQLKSIVEEGHDNDKSVSLSIGGWTGSLYFSSLVGSESSRTKFVKSITNAVEEYDLDAINIDWEYPNSANGVACNQNDPADTANYLTFVQQLRESLPEGTLINAAVATAPFNDENQQPSASLDPEWKNALDGFYIMGYDVNGNWNEKVGPNAPLYFKDQSDGIDSVSADSAVKAWIDAGIPADQLYLGVPFYGRIAQVKTGATSSSGMYQPLDGKQIKGDKYDEKAADPCPNAVSTFSGMYQWRSIESQGIPTNSSGWETSWDEASQTPYAYNGNRVLSFDDPHSLQAKVKYAKANGLGGVMLWSLEMDDVDNTLLNALQGIRND
ncbi:hypothetical protein INT45_005745 [Circinella minor]|uniref:GH18 domain-containing protein n=1 Tax=Circinella minor TaxID=1195481 RepID=A0A8H7SC39_9FUNG|nr:hypothetical protein INT45_005745 [Circinella minor]